MKSEKMKTKSIKRRVITAAVILLAGTILTVLTYCVIQFFSLKLYVSDDIIVQELTREEKEEDFRYLTGYVQDCYPYSEVVKSIKGLDSVLELQDDFIKRAGETRDNLEFMKLFLEYAGLLGQAGHYGIQWFTPEQASAGFCYMFDIPKDAFYKTKTWSTLGSKLSLYVHSDLEVKYIDGAYVVVKDKKISDIEIPEGAKIIDINGQPVDEYVRSLQARQVLRYDSVNKKVYASDLFRDKLTDNDTSWEVKFALNDGKTVSLSLPMLAGAARQPITPVGNVLCTEINPTTGYIALASFEQQFIESDNKSIQEFMSSSNGRYTKLILDVRGNSGGEPSSYMENLIRPLLKEPVQYKELTAVKKSYFSRMGLHYKYYRIAASNHLLDKEINHIINIDTVPVADFDPDKWEIYEVTKELTPNNNFPFDGDVYVLCDDDTLSAGDSFVRTVKETGIGLVVGTNTLGWGNIFMQPNYCALPNSGLILRMDIEMPLNSDGTVNSVYGTAPDVRLPVQYGERGFDLASLQNDEWIQWILQNK